jgi:hypothetical protein
MAATSTSTTTIISIRTTILIGTSVAKAATGNTIRNTAGTLLTATEEPRTSSVVRVRAELVIDPALAVLAVRVAQEARAALAVPEDQAVPAVRAALVVPENPVVRAAWAVLVAPGDPVVPESPVELVVRVAPAELEQGPAAAALERDPVVAELAPVQVVAVPVRDLVALPPKNKWAIALHRPGQVPRLVRVEDLAAAAETTREPAATEAVAAWAAVV